MQRTAKGDSQSATEAASDSISCDVSVAGGATSIGFKDLGELHLRYQKAATKPYPSPSRQSTATVHDACSTMRAPFIDDGVLRRRRNGAQMRSAAAS